MSRHSAEMYIFSCARRSRDAHTASLYAGGICHIQEGMRERGAESSAEKDESTHADANAADTAEEEHRTHAQLSSKEEDEVIIMAASV